MDDSEAAVLSSRQLDGLRRMLLYGRGCFDLDGHRVGIRTALAGCINYVTHNVPDGIDLILPLRELLSALHDLDDGVTAPFLRPSKTGKGGRRTPRSVETFRATAAVLMDLYHRSGKSRSEAATQTALDLNERGYRDDRKELITPKRVEDWRDKVNEGGDGLGARRFKKALDILGDCDQETAIGLILESLPAIAATPIPTGNVPNQNASHNGA